MTDLSSAPTWADSPPGRRLRGALGRIPGGLAAAGTNLLDALLPTGCSLCGDELADRRDALCLSCDIAVRAACNQPYCMRCGQTVSPHAGHETACPTCDRQRFRFDSAVRVGAYAGGLRTLLRAFKFHAREELDRDLSARLARVIARLAIYEELDALVPVPTCWQHRLHRPFHPATALARQTARRCHIPYAPLLVRTGGGPHQLGLSHTARQQNVRGRFKLTRGCAVPGARLLLLDDVMTTGATAGECARVLKAAGADEVHVAVIARAGDDPATLRHV
jgi:ComF family protein